jgi:DNA-binding CsgD family transcriptional regulator
MPPSSQEPGAPPIVAAGRRDPAVWDRAEEVTGVASWRWELDTGAYRWSRNFYSLMGVEPAPSGALTPSDFWDRVHPADAARLTAALESTMRGEHYGAHEYRIVRPDGCVRHLHSVVAADEAVNGTGRGRVLVGLVRDVTDERASERTAALNVAISESLARWEAFRPGFLRVLERVGATLGSAAAALWVPERELLSLRILWTRGATSRTAVERQLGKLRMRRGVCLAGRAWAERAPVSATPGQPTVPATWSLEIFPTVAFPVVDSGGVLAVVALYGDDSVAEGADLLQELGDLGERLGMFMQRRVGALRSGLTARETEVLTLAAQGLGGPAIAEALSLSGATVKTHLANAYAKIGVSSRVAAVAFALRTGLIE